MVSGLTWLLHTYVLFSSTELRVFNERSQQLEDVDVTI